MGYYMAGGPTLGLANNPFRRGAVRAAYGDPAVESSRAENLANLLSGAGARSARVPDIRDTDYGGRNPVTGEKDEFFRDTYPRRMNMANPRAVRRAVRRITAFAKAAVKIMPNLRRSSSRSKRNPFARKRKRK